LVWKKSEIGLILSRRTALLSISSRFDLPVNLKGQQFCPKPHGAFRSLNDASQIGGSIICPQMYMLPYPPHEG